jgi:sarcosine oxidase, subunit alpha
VTQPFRIAAGGLVDRDELLTFTFDGQRLTGYRGDTLASALLANGVRLVGRSFKYHRPRGIVTAGPEEPNALVRLGWGPRAVPNVKATEVPLHEGLEAESQRGWPSTRVDLGAAADRFSRLLPAGFYYKTFMRPRWLWPRYEHVLRRAASSARPPEGPDPDRYDKRHAHCDVLVVGAGPAGLAAALAATRAGARVILADEHPRPGGSLLDHDVTLDGTPATEWVEEARAELEAAPRTTVLTRTTVFGRYVHRRFGAVQHLDAGIGRQRYWHIQPGRAVLATGSLERPLVFVDNDRPGVMLAAAVRRYVRRFGVAPGRRAVVVTNNDTAYGVVPALGDAGVEVRAVVDVRAASGDEPDGVPVLDRGWVVGVRGGRGVEGVEIARGKDRHRHACDLLVV